MEDAAEVLQGFFNNEILWNSSFIIHILYYLSLKDLF